MEIEQVNVIDNIEKKKRGRPSKSKESKTEHKNEYMKNYMKEYNKTHKYVTQCEACNKPIYNSNKKNHFSSVEHNFNVLQKKLENIEALDKK